MSKSCYGYVRVSTVKQGEGVSLEAQRDAITAFAEKNELTITRWFEEKETAAKRGRPVFSEMIRELKRGRAQGLVVHKIDRSARNFSDWAKIGDLADLGVDIHFATESLDFRSRGGRLAADIQAVVAADYVRNLREETIKGLNGRLKQGLYPFRAPIGYLDNGKGMPKTIDPIQGPLVRKLFALYASGEHSIRSLMPEMHRRGLRSRTGGPVTKTGMETILGNPFYIGLIHIRRTGKTYEGVHEPLLAPSLYEKVQARKQGRQVKRVVRHDFTYRRLFRCAHCQTAMIPERQKGHVYYRCHTRACPTTTVRETTLERDILNALDALRIAPGQTQAFETDLTARIDTSLTPQDGNIATANLGKVTAKLDRLTDALISGVVDQDTYRAKHRDLLIEKAAIEQQRIAEADRSRHEETRGKFLELAKNLAALYIFATPAEKRQVVEIAFSNRVIDGRESLFSPRSWLYDAVKIASVFSGPHSEDRTRRGAEYPKADTRPLIKSEEWGELTRLTEVLQSICDRSRGQQCPGPDADGSYLEIASLGK